jgi:ABC-type antimicrobial peptide transport system permease subunit
MQAQIYGIDATDPTVIGIVVATLGIVAVTACLLPARRATQVDPIITLNEQ